MSPDPDSELKQALARLLLAMADDELVLGHRDSEWTGHAPILEEDIAFSNIAQDELGHAIAWYGLLGELTGDEPNELVYFRDHEGYRNVVLVELPNDDWAFSMMRQYLFDAFEMVKLSKLIESLYRPVAEAAAKIRIEEMYHYRHTSNWIKRLGLGTEESNRRLQGAADTLWPYTSQLFVPLPGEEALLQAGYVASSGELHRLWNDLVMPFLEGAGLLIPSDKSVFATRRSQHTDHLKVLLADLQAVARMYPDAQW